MIENIRYLLDIWISFANSFDTQTLSVIILGLTLIIIGRYTMASFGILKETKFQTDLMISPIIIVTFDKEKDIFVIKNIGKGIALNIMIDSFTLFLTDMNVVWVLKFDSLNLLEPNGQENLNYKTFENGKEIQGTGENILYAYITPSDYGKEDYELAVQYQNSLGHKYYTRLTTGKSGVKILEISKKKLLRWWGYKLRTFIWEIYIRVDVYFKRKFKYKLKKKTTKKAGGLV
jgi:hypothetical protein